MKRTVISFLSKDGKTRIHAVEWKPDRKPAAVLQICHGMVEYIERYEDFAVWLTGKGIAVVGHDHLGHGRSVLSDEKHGFFADPDGNECVIADIHTLRRIEEPKFPGVPYLMLGHSMGSFLLRQYLTLHGEGLTGAIVMGTGYQAPAMLAAGKTLCKLLAAVKGWEYRSELVDNMAFASYNKGFQPARTDKDWLTKDEGIVDRYIADPFCTFRFTLNGYYHMFRGIEAAEKPAAIACIPKELPVLFTAGACDPVGENGKGVRTVCESYRNAGLKNVSLRLYENDRHEILNEIDRAQVYEDLFAWMKEAMA